MRSQNNNRTLRLSTDDIAVVVRTTIRWAQQIGAPRNGQYLFGFTGYQCTCLDSAKNWTP